MRETHRIEALKAEAARVSPPPKPGHGEAGRLKKGEPRVINYPHRVAR